MKPLNLSQAKWAFLITLILSCFNAQAVKMFTLQVINTSEDNPGPQIILALKRIIIPVMWTTEAEVRAVSFPV